MPSTLRAAAVAVFLGLPVVCPGQTDTPVTKPDVKVGDSWTYRRMDYWANKPTATREIRVAHASDRAIQIVVSEPGGREFDETYTPDWNAVATSRANFNPHSGWLKFPLQVGATYKLAYEMEFGAARNWRVRQEHTVKVLGWEEIVVPAGKFRALKIETEGEFRRLDTSAAGTAKYTIWYVPEVKRWVKFMYEDVTAVGGPRGANNKFGEELVEFKLQ